MVNTVQINTGQTDSLVEIARFQAIADGKVVTDQVRAATAASRIENAPVLRLATVDRAGSAIVANDRLRVHASRQGIARARAVAQIPIVAHRWIAVSAQSRQGVADFLPVTDIPVAAIPILKTGTTRNVGHAPQDWIAGVDTAPAAVVAVRRDPWNASRRGIAEFKAVAPITVVTFAWTAVRESPVTLDALPAVRSGVKPDTHARPPGSRAFPTLLDLTR